MPRLGPTASLSIRLRAAQEEYSAKKKPHVEIARLTLTDRKMSRTRTSASPNARTVLSVSKFVKLKDLSTVTALAAACSATKALLNALAKCLVQGGSPRESRSRTYSSRALTFSTVITESPRALNLSAKKRQRPMRAKAWAWYGRRMRPACFMRST